MSLAHQALERARKQLEYARKQRQGFESLMLATDPHESRALRKLRADEARAEDDVRLLENMCAGMQ